MSRLQRRGLSYENHVILSLFVVFTVIASIAVAARIWVRGIKRVRIWADDCLLIVALFLQYLILADVFVAVNCGGLGQDVADVVVERPEAVVNLLKCLFVFSILCGLCSPLVKIAVLATYWRMFPTKTIKIGACALGATCIGWCIVVELTTIFECRPIAKIWDEGLEGGCITSSWLFVGKSIPNCTLDLMILLLPVLEVVRQDLSTSRKIAVGCLFLLAGLVVAAGIFHLAKMAIVYYSGLENITQQIFLPLFAITMQLNLTTIGICLPTLGPVVRVIHEYGTTVTRNMASRGSSAGGEVKSSRTLNGIMAIGRTSNRNRVRSLSTVENHGMVEGSFMRLDNVDSDVEALTLTPKGYSCEQHTRIRSTRVGDGTYEEPIPLDGIVVKRDMCWAEDRKE